MYKHFFKRCFDFIVSLLALVALMPIFLIVAILIKSDSKGPIFFVQERIGINKSIFKILKFRTMITEAPKDCPPYEFNDPENYITRIGKFLRKTSIDELPQLINILKGDMSLVGPRPSTPKEVILHQLRDSVNAHSVLPGLTGLAQIKGRDELPIVIKSTYDGEYIKKISFYYDFKIILLTVIKVFKCDGIREGAGVVQLDMSNLNNINNNQ